MSEAGQWTDDGLSVHYEDDGEYLIVQLSEKWWDFIQQNRIFAIPLARIEEVKQARTQERSAVDALLKSALGTEE